MELCDGCIQLEGRSSGLAGNDEMTLVGIGQCEGRVALEHYRCRRCGALMVRQLCGESIERIWMVLA